MLLAGRLAGWLTRTRTNFSSLAFVVSFRLTLQQTSVNLLLLVAQQQNYIRKRKRGV